ncbi:DNA polymerase I [Lactobacillus sp. CBA3605]|uniref:DNA polymerase I n=1 Tax=Lactobacillus sp. CBA3605 TaxID=2099788 RepID=UPI000CFD3A77|nr:DNA polymerase I [Lactobacillus sp. CBA3605]AVK62378.1 DNA polymerase I [Lactobacillus sp. CBA3605]
MAKKLLLIDGNSVAFRAFFALHNQLERFVNADGLHTTAIYGFNTMLDHMIKAVEPTDMLVAFDAGKTTFRTGMFDGYKSGRAKTPSEFSEQMPYIKKLLDAYGIQHYELKDFEADDIIGTLSKAADEAGYTTTIVTGDRDLTQLTTDQTTVAVTVKGVSEVERYTPEHVQEKLGITPTQIIDMKGLTGDTSDNYPGVTKVGEKTALKLLKQYESLEGVFENVAAMKPSKMKEHLIEDQALAERAKVLATIKRDAPITVGLADLAYTGPDIDQLAEFYQAMDFQSFLKKIKIATNEPAKPIAYTELTTANLNELAQFKTHVEFYLELPAANYHTSAVAGFAIGHADQWYISRDVELLLKPELAELLASTTIQKNVFDMKRTMVGLNRLGLSLKAVDFDLLLVSYLLDTNDNSNDLGNLAEQHGYLDLPTDEEVYGKGVKRAIPEDNHIFFSHLARKLAAIAALKPDLLKKLDENEQTPLYHDIEKPMALVLAQMEIAGITVDSSRLKAMGSQFKERLSEIEQVIYQEAGQEFNIKSPKQLGKILFEEMHLPVLKKTKTGYSTAVDVLEKLAPEAPIVANILQYRQISKIQSTYVEGLLDAIHSTDQKVHTRYLQTLTQTGRLSSVDPNLQNIPVRVEEGRRIRQAFVPSHAGWQIFSSDYSQIELRVLAHITHDENMQAAFKAGDDIHAATAMRIFNLKSPADVTPNIRRQAKAVNFGIVYGISDYGLSQNIGITRKQARSFIDAYFAEYPGVKQYMTDIVKTAKEQGYVETIAHRRRYLPDINSASFNQRAFAERTAMNTPIQGSAADIIKIAMINMQAQLKASGLQATMLLQVHDELIFEAPAAEIPTLEKLVPSVMDSAIKLAVPLKVESHFGNTWYDAK